MPSTVHWITSIGIVLCVAVISVFCLWALDRGLDLTDESYYLAAAIQPEAVVVWATAMHWLTAPLWRITGTLVAFRGIGLAILTASSAILAAGAVQAFRPAGGGGRARGGSTPLVAACSLVAALVYHSFMPFTPSYNLLAAAGANAGLGLVLLAAGQPSRLRGSGFYLLAGAALALAFLAKFSAGLSAWCVVCGVAVAFGSSRRERIREMGLITVSMAVAVTAAVLMHGTLPEVLEQFKRGALVYMLGANETLETRLARYSRETIEYLGLVVRNYGLPLAVFGLHAIRQHGLIALTGFAALCLAVLSGDFLLGGMGHYERQTAPLLALVILVLLLSRRSWMRNGRVSCVLGALAVLPFCVAIGTYNALSAQILFSLAPWGVLIGVLAFSNAGAAEARPLIQAIGTLFVAIVAAQVLSSGFRAPYRLNRPLSEQSEEITVPPLGRFRVDRESRESYAKLNELAKACRIAPGSPFLGLYNVPGVALILQAVPVGFPILQDRPSTEAVLDGLPPELVKSAVVGLDQDSGSYDPGIPKQLGSFPAGYRLCGTVILPYQKQRLELWLRGEYR
ncbi:MAG: hypothetical protein FIA97_10030 [Methylococcaceae bacterium]|nr:hypothetical protein [Methylococcaceae bacterium]